MSGKLLTVAQAAELAHLSRTLVYRMVNDGSIPCIRFGSSIRIRPESIGLIEMEAPSTSKQEPAKSIDPPKEKTFFDSLRPELEKAFKNIPDYGEVGFRLFIHDSQVVRIEYVSSKSIKMELTTIPGNNSSKRDGEYYSKRFGRTYRR